MLDRIYTVVVDIKFFDPFHLPLDQLICNSIVLRQEVGQTGKGCVNIITSDSFCCTTDHISVVQQRIKVRFRAIASMVDHDIYHQLHVPLMKCINQRFQFFLCAKIGA